MGTSLEHLIIGRRVLGILTLVKEDVKNIQQFRISKKFGDSQIPGKTALPLQTS